LIPLGGDEGWGCINGSRAQNPVDDIETWAPTNLECALTGRDQVLNTLLNLTALSRANPGKEPSGRFITRPVQHIQVASLRSPEAKSNFVASAKNRLGINSLPASTLLKFNNDLN